MWQKIIKDKKIIGGLTLLILVAAVPLTLNLASRQQNLQQRAATPTSCSINNPIDAMLIIDKSGSMGPPVNPDDRITPAKAAAKNFVNILYSNGKDQSSNKKSQAGVVSFAQLTNSTEGKTTLDSPLTLLSAQSNVTSVNAKIDTIKIFGRTCIQCGVRLANEEIKTNGRAGVKKIVVLLTDGGANAYDGHLTADGATAEKAANDEVDKGHTDNGTTFFTIGLGKDVNVKFLQSIASRTGGKYYFAPTAADLDLIYQQISTIVGKGSISGTVYNDANASKTKNTNEAGLPGWKVSLINGTTQAAVGTTTTDDQGNYTFPGICDDSYQVKLTIQPTWTLTIPTNPDYLSPSIANGNVLTNQNFGVKQEAQRSSLTCSPSTMTLTESGQQITATLKDGSDNPLSGKVITWKREGSITQITPTTGTTSNAGIVTTTALIPPNETTVFLSGKITATFAGDNTSASSTCDVITEYTPNETTITFTIFMHGIGNSGDSTNTIQSSLSNKNPVHPQRNLKVTIFDSENTFVSETEIGEGLIYNATDGNFKAVVGLGSPFATGNYLVRVHSDYHLQRQFPGIVRLTAGQNNTPPAITLVAGDVDNGNQLDIRDYNAIIDCYSDFEPPISCDADKKITTDLNDDDAVNQFDYNLFLRDLAVQNGE